MMFCLFHFIIKMMVAHIAINQFKIFMTLISFESEENAIANIREIIKIMITLKITCFLLIIIETPFILSHTIIND